MPTLGTALVIAFATPSTLTGRVLASTPLVQLGLISYGIYIWHQPLFAFARLHSTRELTPLFLALLCLVSGVLAYLSWRFVERPFRDRKNLTRVQIFSLAGGFNSIANKNRVNLTRKTKSGARTVVLSVESITDGSTPDIPLQGGDLIYVNERVF